MDDEANKKKNQMSMDKNQKGKLKQKKSTHSPMLHLVR